MYMFRGCGHPYGYPRPVAIYLDIHTDIRADVRAGVRAGVRADVRVELSMLRTVRPGMACVALTMSYLELRLTVKSGLLSNLKAPTCERFYRALKTKRSQEFSQRDKCRCIIIVSDLFRKSTHRKSRRANGPTKTSEWFAIVGLSGRSKRFICLK